MPWKNRKEIQAQSEYFESAEERKKMTDVALLPAADEPQCRPVLRRLSIAICVLAVVMRCQMVSLAQNTKHLPGSGPLRPRADKLTAQRQQVFDYFDRRIVAAQGDRDKFWQPEFSSWEGYQRSLESHRGSLRKMLGLIENNLNAGAAKVERAGESKVFRIERVTIPISEGLAARGLLFTPRSSGKKPATITCPDADTWPERLAQTSSLLDGRSIVFVQQSIERLVDHPYCKKTRGKDRRWILYRLGYVVGWTMPGLDVQDTLAAVEFLATHKDVDTGKISIVGNGQGGMTALLTAALDSRISEVTVSDYFDCRNRCWAEPVDRRLRNQLLEFGDAELAALIAPRRLTIKASAEFLGSATSFEVETRRAARFFDGLAAGDRLTVVTNRASVATAGNDLELRFPEEWATSSRNTHFEERLIWLRRQIDESEAKRYARWKILERPATEFPDVRKAMLRDYRQMTGTLPDDGTPMKVRSELALATETYRAYRVTIDVAEGVDVYGHLLLPSGFDGKRPAVICQHGFGGMPEKVTGVGMTEDSAYHEFGRKLAEKGYVVFAPTLMHIQPSEEVSKQMRQANAIGMMRLAMPVAKTKRVIDFLDTLPSVDKDRIGYYGLSYGGYSAIWMTPLLDRLAVSIVSGNFNDWRTKITSDELNTSYLRHPDEDMYSWNCLNRFTHPELIAMMLPRPVCIEYGNRDAITTPEWTARAWKQTEIIRDHLGQTDRISLVEFDGPHEIHGIETFQFLDRWLLPEDAAGR
jgi:cephalosporin-C deacetylase-like acetyl esterase